MKNTIMKAVVVALMAVAALAAPPKPDADMKALLDTLASLKPKPIEKLSVAEARKQPGFPQAVKKRLEKKGEKPMREPVAKVEDVKVAGGAGEIPARIYTPSGTGPFPVIVYFHGGGWVIASVDAYDASARGLANAAGAIVVSVGYRMAPEHKFPAAHEDAYAATQYVIKNAASMGGDPGRVAVAGESAGGNLAAAVCLMARDRKAAMPVHQLLVYPVANYAFDTPSYVQNANAKPLNKPMMTWFFKHYLRSPADGAKAWVSLLKANVKGLPPATVVLAEIDPLRSEGAAYAKQLQKAGVATEMKLYTGVTHEFFGAGAVVAKGKEAVTYAGGRLKAAFSK